MRRRKGLGSSIFSLIMFILVAGLVLAFIKQFDWDVFAAFGWLGQKFLDAVYRVADTFSNMDAFQKLVR